MVKRWSVIALGAAAVALLGSCGLFGGDITEIPGSKIYSISTRQLAQPSKIEITVTVDSAAREEMIAALGDNYFEPDELFVWMALKRQNDGTFADARDFHPLAKFNLDSAVESYSQVVDLLALASSWSNYSGDTVNWLNKDELFDEFNTWDNMNGFYLFASDGWTNGRDGEYELTGKSAFDTIEGRFFDRFPKGQGFSNYEIFPDPEAEIAEEWVDIVAAAGGWTVDIVGNELSSADIVTVTYVARDSFDADPVLNIEGWEIRKANCATIDGVTWDGTSDFGGTAGTYKWKITFGSGSGVVYDFTLVGEDGNSDAVDDIGVQVNLSSTGWKYYSFSASQYTSGNFNYLGTLLLVAQEDFDGDTLGIDNKETYVSEGYYYDYSVYKNVQYDASRNHWIDDAGPSAYDRSSNVPATLSSGKVLMTRAPIYDDYSYYENNRYDYYDFILSDSDPDPDVGYTIQGDDIMVAFSQRSDFADGDELWIQLVMSNGTVHWMSSISKYNSTENNNWDTSIVDGWQKYRTTFTGIGGGVVSRVRFVFYSNDYYTARGVTIDNLKVYDVE